MEGDGHERHLGGTATRLSLVVISLAAGVALSSPGLAQDEHAHDAAASAAAASDMINAQVIKVDQSAGNISCGTGRSRSSA